MTADPLEPRPYQVHAIAAVLAHIRRGGPPGVMQAPTGSGKTLVGAEVLREFRGRSLWVAHRAELVEQAERAIRRQWPGVDLGVQSATLARGTLGRDVICGTIGSVLSRRERLGRFDLVILDEAHLLRPAAAHRAAAVLEHVREDNPAARVLGLTATPFTLAGGPIFGEGQPFAELVHAIPIRDLIDQGYLVPLRGVSSAPFAAAFGGLRKRAGDFMKGDAEAAALSIVDQAIGSMLQRCVGCRRVLVFSPGVAHAELVAQRLRERGEAAAAVCGGTPRDERAAILAAFRDGRLRFVSNADLLTTGYDEPEIDAVVLMRPTASTALYLQQLGRAMRPAPGKVDALLLDFAGNVRLHGSVVEPFVARPSAGIERSRDHRAEVGGSALVRICSLCGVLHEPSATICRECSATLTSVPHDAEPGDLDPMSKPAWCRVEAVAVHIHRRRSDGLPMLRLSFRVEGGRWVRDYITFYGAPRWMIGKAHATLAELLPPSLVPSSIAEASQRLQRIREHLRQHVEAVLPSRRNAAFVGRYRTTAASPIVEG